MKEFEKELYKKNIRIINSIRENERIRIMDKRSRLLGYVRG